MKPQDLEGELVYGGAFTNYVDKILPIIDHLPTVIREIYIPLTFL